MVRFMEEEKDLKGIKFSPKQTYLSASSNINFKRNLSKIDLVTNPSSWIKKILDSILKSDKKSDHKSWEIGKQWTKKMQNWQTNIITFWFDEKIHGLCGSWQIEASLFLVTNRSSVLLFCLNRTSQSKFCFPNQT